MPLLAETVRNPEQAGLGISAAPHPGAVLLLGPAVEERTLVSGIFLSSRLISKLDPQNRRAVA